jgi:hypothetical protein
MFRHLRIRRWLSATLLLPLAAGPAFGAEGVIVNMAGPNCPGCNAPGSPPCPANVKYFGYYPTRWRPWPGTGPAPTPVAPVELPIPDRVTVPPAGQEATGKPGATTGDTGTGIPPAGSTTDPNSSTTPANPNAPPGTGVPMLNGLPLPSGARLPNGALVPNVTLPNDGPQPNGVQPNGGSIPGVLPAPNQPDPAAKGSQLFAPVEIPVAMSVKPLSNEPVRLNQDWPNPTRPAPAPLTIAPAAIIPPAMATEIRPTVTPASAIAPSYQWPPANMLRSSTMKAGFQTPAETAVPKESHSGTAAWIEPLPPLDAPHASAPIAAPSNSLRINMPQPVAAQKPARPAAIDADNWSAANSPATLAPLYKFPAADRTVGNASLNSPGAISPVAHSTVANPTVTQAGPASEIRFSPLRDAVANVHLSMDERPSQSMSAIDPLQIGRAMADDQQPAMRAVPIRNALPTNRFEAADYAPQDRAANPTSYASTHQPMPSSSAPGIQRTTDTAVRPASFEQAAPGAAPNLVSIDPLEVARSLGATPAPLVPTPPRAQSAGVSGAAATGYPQTSR